MAWAEAYLRTKWHLDPSSNLATVQLSTWTENRGSCCAPFLGRGAGCPFDTMSPGPRPTSVLSGILIHLAVWLQRTWAENWGFCPFLRGRAGSPSKKNVAGAEACHHANFHLDPSSRLATIRQRYRQDRPTDRQDIT